MSRLNQLFAVRAMPLALFIGACLMLTTLMSVHVMIATRDDLDEWFTKNTGSFHKNIVIGHKLFENVYKGIYRRGYSKKRNLNANETYWYNNMSGHSWETPIYDDKHNITFCHIPKNTGTLFKALFFAITQNRTLRSAIKVHHYSMVLPRFNSPYTYVDFLFDKDWKSWVVLRDPLERLLAGYLHICLKRGFQKFKNPDWCLGLKVKDQSDLKIIYNFTLFAEHFITKWKELNGGVGDIARFNHHYVPQHKFCLLQYYINYYDYIVYIKKQQLESATLYTMQKMGIAEYLYIYGANKNESLFAKESGTTSNATHIDKLNRYFTKELVWKLYDNVFYEDYKYLNLPLPHWIHLLD